MASQGSLYTVEKFKFTILDAVPRPDADEAYLLYKDGKQDGKFLLITSRNPAMSHQIRSGGYNRKVTVSLAWKRMEIRRTILDESGQFDFYVAIQVDYRVKDAQYIYVNGLENVEPQIESKIGNLLQSVNKCYDIESQVELEYELQGKIARELASLKYLEIALPNISAVLDERARRIIDGKLDNMAESVLMHSKGELESEKVEQQRVLGIQKLEAERDLEEKRRMVALEKAKEYLELKETIGENPETVMAYIKGEISSVELDERIQGRQKAEMMNKIGMLKQLVDMGVADDRLLEKATMQLLGVAEGSDRQEDVQKLEQKREEDVIIDDSEEY